MIAAKKKKELDLPDGDPVRSARSAGLRYVSDEQSGIRRRKAGKSFTYIGPGGATVRDKEVIARIRSLAIPPAWTDVWICPLANGHLQATGRDARGRKQYRYHPRWREVRDEIKFGRMIAFGRALPELRARVEQDLALPGLSRNRVLATVVRLLEVSLIRVGNEEYRKENQSFGLTTMRTRHVDINGSELSFEYKGKGGKMHRVRLRDRKLVRIVGRCKDLPGYQLFQYMDDDGQRQAVDSEDVNEYIREVTGAEFTAKDFRTWAGTVLAAMALREFERVDSQAQAKKNVLHAVEEVAGRLGNTPAICRKCYIHPHVIDAYMEGGLAETVKERARKELREKVGELPPEEAAVLAFLEKRLEAPQS
jgi:DNA topoisomerase I